MFEKEAEENANQFIKNHSESDKFINCKRETDNYNVILAQGYELGFQKGAEFGYKEGIKTLDDMTRAFNREHKKYTDLRIANEWHYVKDRDLPKDEDWKWCVSYRGYYYVAKYEEMFGCWTNQEYSEVMQPYAWKEIVLPELKESE